MAAQEHHLLGGARYLVGRVSGRVEQAYRWRIRGPQDCGAQLVMVRRWWSRVSVNGTVVPASGGGGEKEDVEGGKIDRCCVISSVDQALHTFCLRNTF